ncbi:MAG: tetratricopeptide repeat protein [Pseudomonadota bacterium]
MLESDYESIKAFLDTNWGWAAGLAGAMVVLTVAAGSLLHPDRKVAIGLWLAGAESEETWSKSFVSLFDAVFGERHLSFTCFLRSTIASLIAVAAIWLMMGEAGALEVRLEAGLSLGAVLVIALGVNVLADYVSLLETRWLLGQMHRLRSFWAQLGVLVGDFLVSAAIIWAAIWLYVASPLHEGEIDSFAEILGIFSIFSVAFYSTFLTSVWTWAYILSTWVMRVFTRLELGSLLDVEGKPVRILSLAVGLVTFLAALAASLPMQRDADGLTLVDRTLCTVFKGPVCLDVAGLTETEQAELDLILLACEGGLTEECVSRGAAGWEIRPAEAARLFRVACDGGNARGCTILGFLHHQGLGMAVDLAAAARLYRQGCDGGSALGCSGLGVLHEKGLGMGADLAAAARLYRQGCEMGHEDVCGWAEDLERLEAGGAAAGTP